MPTLDWLNRAQALTAADRVPYRVRDPVSEHGDGNPATDARPNCGHPAGGSANAISAALRSCIWMSMDEAWLNNWTPYSPRNPST